MADVQISAPAPHVAPFDYVIPGAQEIILKTLFASFDGSAAAAAWYPAIQLIAPGNVLAGTFKTSSSVAAGGSADVTFGPFLEDEAAATPVTSTGLPFAFMQRTSVLVTNFVATTTKVDFDLANAHVSGFSSDTSIFDVGIAVSGVHGIKIKAEGQYLWTASAVGSPAAAPAANATAAITTSWDNGDCWVSQYVSPFLTGPGAAATQTQPSLVEQFNLKAGGTAPPQSSTVFLSQNSGGNCTFGQVTFAVFQLSTTGTLDFT